MRIRSGKLRVGDQVQVELCLPDGWSTRVIADVLTARLTPRGGAPELTLKLTGMTDPVAHRLRALAAPHVQPTASTAWGTEGRRTAAGTPRPEIVEDWGEATWEELMTQMCASMKVSHLLKSNRQLADQLEVLVRRRLAGKNKPQA